MLLVNGRHERLIDGLPALAEGEQTLLDRRSFDLTDVAEHVLDQAVAEAAEREVTMHRLLDAAPTTGAAVLVERLVQNLLENAIRHNHPKGEVWVTTRRRTDQVHRTSDRRGARRHRHGPPPGGGRADDHGGAACRVRSFRQGAALSRSRALCWQLWLPAPRGPAQWLP